MSLTKITLDALGSSITINADALTSGTVPLDRLSAANSSANGIVTTSGQTFAGDKTFQNTVTVTGNLTVLGTSVTLNSENVLIKDNIITLNSNVTGSPVLDAGIEVNRGTSANVILKWNETSDKWQLTNDGTTYETIVLPSMSANTSANGVVDTTTQTFAGNKTFQNTASFSNTVSITGAANALSTFGVGGTLSALGQLSVTGNATFDTSTLFVDATNNRVGIGTSSPIQLLDVSANSSTSAYAKISGRGRDAYFGQDSTGCAVYSSGNAPMYFVTNDTERLRITSGGYVGIGVTSPSYQLSVLGRILSSGSSGVSDGYQYGIAADTTLSGTIESNILYAGGTIAANTTVTTRAGLRVDNVAKLSGASVGTNYGVYIANQTAGTTNWAIYSAGGDVAIAAAAKFYLDSGGDTYITEYSANTLRGYVGGTFAWQSGSTIWYFQTEISVPSGQEIFLDGGPAAGAGDSYLSEAGANVIRVTVGGVSAVQWDTTGMYLNTAPPTSASAANAVVGSGSDYLRRSTSSIRYKHDIATLDATDAVSAVMAMRPVTYRGKTDEDQRRFVGFVAEEMQEIAPLLCTYDEGGESGTPNYVTYDRVTAYLVAVVQQQQNEINALKARLATLEG